MSAPIVWTWDGDAMVPAARFVRQANAEYVVGERYLLEPVDEQQSARDRAYHANFRESWMQLPEEMATQFPTPSDFRRWCLVECGFCTVTKLAFASARDAMSSLPLLRFDGAQVAVVGAAVVVKRPLSQKLGKRGDMDKETRLRSYRETADLAASLIGVSPTQIESNAGMAA